MSPRPRQGVPRSRRRIEVRYGLPGKPPMIGYSGNVSPAGMMIRTPRVLPPGSVLQIELRFPQRAVKLRGRVVWAREGSIEWLSTGKIGMGIKFVEPPADLAEVLRG